jgi:hypothetical protein
MLTIAGGIILAIFGVLALLAVGGFLSLCIESVVFALRNPRR